MSITTFAAYKAALAAPYQRIVYTAPSPAGLISNALCSYWKLGSIPGSNPSTAAVPTAATAGALSYPAFVNSTGGQALAQIETVATTPNYWWLCDRLSHSGGLSGTVTSAQTTNLPTAALTRSTDGVGVIAALEIYTQIGATGTTFTASYTNSGATAGRTSEAWNLGATNVREAGRVVILPLQSGDVGVKSVESVTVLATTGTAGNFGVTLFKVLAAFASPCAGSVGSVVFDGLLNNGGNIPAVPDNACLFLIGLFSFQTGTPGAQTLAFTFIEV